MVPVFGDIEGHDLIPSTRFDNGRICPIYKKWQETTQPGRTDRDIDSSGRASKLRSSKRAGRVELVDEAPPPREVGPCRTGAFDRRYGARWVTGVGMTTTAAMRPVWKVASIIIYPRYS